MSSPFSESFVRLRKAAGFETAYQFFHKNGGPKVFGCTFQNYLRIEKGTNLPVPKRLPHLCALLRLPLRSGERKELVKAYLRTWAGSDELADWMTSPFELPPEEPAAAPDPAAAALRRVVRDSAKPIALADYKAIMDTEAGYWCYRVLTTSRETWTEAALAKLLHLSASDVAKGLALLKARGIARRGKDGEWTSPLAGEFLVFPDTALIPKELMKRVYAYNEKMIKRRGAVVDERYCGVRADGAALEGYLAHFRDAIRSVNAYSVTEKTKRSGLFFVEGRVFKLFDF
jgi:hypothetical protein